MKFSTLVFLVINAIFFACLVSANPIAEDAENDLNKRSIADYVRELRYLQKCAPYTYCSHCRGAIYEPETGVTWGTEKGTWCCLKLDCPMSM